MSQNWSVNVVCDHVIFVVVIVVVFSNAIPGVCNFARTDLGFGHLLSS